MTASLLPAQTPAAQDSILARLERAEEQIALLRQQLATQAASGVQSKSGARVEIWGRVLANGWRNTTAVNNLDVPTFAVPGTERFPATAGAVLRQTTLGFDVQGLEVLGGQLTAAISADLSGGVQAGSGNRRLFPEPRLRIARTSLRWTTVEIMVGQDVPLIAGEEPVSLASVGTPDFATAGNLWFWLPQFRVLLETPTRVRVGLQGAVIAPWSGEDPASSGSVDMGERAGRPSLQGRVRAAWGDGARPAEIGVGGHVGWLRRDGSMTRETSRAVAATARIPAGWLELRAEAYAGRLLRGLGGGGVGQNFGSPPVPMAAGPIIDDQGGWAQLNVQPRTAFLIGGGCGLDNPDDGDRPIRSSNRACEGHLHLRPAGPLVLGLEVRKLTTVYRAFRESANSTHVNFALGVEF